MEAQCASGIDGLTSMGEVGSGMGDGCAINTKPVTVSRETEVSVVSCDIGGDINVRNHSVGNEISGGKAGALKAGAGVG